MYAFFTETQKPKFQEIDFSNFKQISVIPKIMKKMKRSLFQKLPNEGIKQIFEIQTKLLGKRRRHKNSKLSNKMILRLLF